MEEGAHGGKNAQSRPKSYHGSGIPLPSLNFFTCEVRIRKARLTFAFLSSGPTAPGPFLLSLATGN